MTHVTKVNGLEKAKSEITARIRQTDIISRQFKNSFTGYSETTGRQKAAVFFLLLLVIALIVFTPFLARTVDNAVRTLDSLFSGYSGRSMELIGMIALYSVCLYMVLFAGKIFMRLSRISQVDGYIAGVNEIKNHLVNSLDNIDSTMETIESDIKQKNIKIVPQGNVDSEIERYRRVAYSYTNTDGSVLDTIIKAVYWVSSALFGIAFIAITGRLVANVFCESFGYDIYNVFLIAYMGLTLGGYIALNIWFARKQKQFSFGSFVTSLFCGPVTIPVFWVLCFIIGIALHLLAIAAVIAIIIAVLKAF